MPTISDHCDRCKKRAYTAWYNPAVRGVVTLCGHHAREYGLTLIAQGFELSIDDRDSLLSTCEPEPA